MRGTIIGGVVSGAVAGTIIAVVLLVAGVQVRGTVPIYGTVSIDTGGASDPVPVVIYTANPLVTNAAGTSRNPFWVQICEVNTGIGCQTLTSDAP